jgi:RNA polymerase sigma-70 factor, ECF subfamily
MPATTTCPCPLSVPFAAPKLRLIEGGLLFRQQLAAAAPGLLPRALRLTRNPDRARDLVQDTCARALTFEDSFTPGTYFRAWLQQVMYSVFVSQCRRRKREQRVVQAWLNDPSCWATAEPPPASAGLLPGLVRALSGLPQVYGRTLWLVDLEERSYQEAASTLGVPVGTIMSRLHRARRMLGEQLAEAA